MKEDGGRFIVALEQIGEKVNAVNDIAIASTLQDILYSKKIKFSKTSRDIMKTIDYQYILKQYKEKKILVTGNTGFKGSWLTHILLSAGAEVTGYAFEPPIGPNLFTIAGISDHHYFKQVTGNVQDLESVLDTFKSIQPEIVFHLAAQPIVRDSFKNPVDTFGTNVMGTVNICEAVRKTVSVRSFLNVTTDKVYRNNEWEWGYREDDILDGLDPYSNSKSCSELVTHSYKDSFFTEGRVSVSTVRAGNVIGGGDFANDRIIPDCVRALANEKGVNAIINVRNPYSTRPYQHVLEPLFMYLMVAIKQYEDASFEGYYNVGPDDIDCVATGNLVAMFCDKWNKMKPDGFPKLSWENKTEDNAPHEADVLKLDCSRIKNRFGWQPRWHIDKAIEQTVKFTDVWMSGGDVKAEMNREIEEYINYDLNP